MALLPVELKQAILESPVPELDQQPLVLVRLTSQVHPISGVSEDKIRVHHLYVRD